MASKYVVQRTSDVDGAVSAAFDVVEDLNGQMSEWADNMEGNNMEHLPKYEEVSEARDALDNVNDERPEVPEHLAALACTYTELLPKPKAPGPGATTPKEIGNMTREPFNRDTFTKRHYAKSAFAGKLAVAAAALADAWVLAGTADKASFLTRLLGVTREYARDVNGWDAADCETMAQVVGGSLRMPHPPFASNLRGDANARTMLAAALAAGRLTQYEHDMLVEACRPSATVDDFRRAFAYAEKLRGDVPVASGVIAKA